MKLEVFRCLKCGHYWQRPSNESEPKKCPHCKSTRWNTIWTITPVKQVNAAEGVQEAKPIDPSLDTPPF